MSSKAAADADVNLVGLKSSEKNDIIANIRPESVAFSKVINGLAEEFDYPKSNEKIIYTIPSNTTQSDRLTTDEDFVNVFRYVNAAIANGKKPEGAEPPKEGETVAPTNKLEEWETKFILEKLINMDRLVGFILAANILDVKSALNAGAATMANGVKGKSPEQIRAAFVIPPNGEPPKLISTLLSTAQ